MSDLKWIDEVDAELNAGDFDEGKVQRDLNPLERRRFDYLSKLAQQQAAEVDLLVAESYAAHGLPQGKMMSSDLDPDENEAINRARNGLELTNARLRVLISKMRKDCNVPFNASLRGFCWYDDSSGKLKKIVQED